MDAVGLICRPCDDAPQEHDIFPLFAHGNTVVADALVLHLRQLVVMRCKERLGVDAAVDMLHHRTRDAHAVKGARTAPDLVENHKAVLRRLAQNLCDLVHLHHKGALPARQVILCPDTGKYTVN